uniref:Protein msta, isoform A n=1 Tax=Cacopsylla melanoneura TaxID=428564 RepID=A0A8D9BF04_9HEMI
MVDNACGFCGEPSSQKCSGCQLVYYCCREHQKKHWSKHKSHCRPMKLCQDNVLGRYYVASRSIKAGEVVLKEVPLVQGPSQVTGPVCLGCLKSISMHTSEECPKCGWPLCRDPQCQLSEHHVPECDWTMSKRGKKIKISNFTAPHPSYECITTLRCLYKKFHQPAVWEKLMQLEAHLDECKKSPRYESDQKNVIQFLLNFFKLDQDFSEAEIFKICGIIQVNAHEMPLTEPGYMAIFDRTSLVEHSCFPNLYKSFTNSGQVLLRAMKPIAAGDHLSICYTDPLWGTINRRHHLEESKYFTCQCDRCRDPTEFNTMYDGVKCPEHQCKGYVLPHLTPSSFEETWICHDCKKTADQDNVHKILVKIGEDLSTIEKQNPEACRKFLKTYDTGRFLHPNHYYLTDVRIALAQLYGQTTRGGIQDLSDEMLTHKIALCKQIVNLARTIVPAEGRIRGIIIFELHASVAELGRRRSSQGQIDSAQLRAFLLESKQYLDEAVWLLQYEPSNLPEGKILVQAQENLSSLNTVLQALHASIGDSPM